MRTRGTILIAFVLLIIAAVFAWKIFNPGPTAFAEGSTVALADYRAANPTGVPADLANADIVKRGEYLARAPDCRACHTVSRDRPYAGGLPLLLPFGTLYSTNITPDKETGIGKYSDQDFLNAVQRGRDALISGNAVSVLHGDDRRRRSCDQGLFVQPSCSSCRESADYFWLSI